MYLFYFDESGDSGHPMLVNTPTNYFVLCCVAVHQSSWRSSLDKLVSMRSQMKKLFGLRVRGEIKAKHFSRGHGGFSNTGIQRDDRMDIYRRIMRFQKNNLQDIHVFSIAINKRALRDTSIDIRTTAWQFALQRVDSFLRKADGESISTNDLGMIFPDEGHGDMIRKLLRQIRRHQRIKGHFGGKLDIPTERIVEDPNDRNSEISYFIQLADWNALAAHRSLYLDPNGTIPSDLWDELGNQRLTQVNDLTGGPPAIVVWPREKSDPSG